MFNYKGVGFTAEKQDELDRQTKAIDGKTIVEYQGVGPSGPATITFDGTTGQKTFSAPKPEESQLTASSATPPAAGVASAGSPTPNVLAFPQSIGIATAGKQTGQG